MLTGRRASLLLLAGLAAWLILATAGLFRARFEVGDIYPPYSSLRTDPMGSRGLFESLGRFPGVRVERNYRPLERLPADPGTALLYLGAGEFGDTAELAADADLRGWASRGGRIVAADWPEARADSSDTSNESDTSDAPDSSDWSDRVDSPAPARIARIQAPSESEGLVATMAGDWPDLPSTLPWTTDMVFTNVSSAWTVLYERDGYPVIVERRVGRGSMILVGDSYPFSNEALRLEPRPALLARLLGPASTVIFDETHLGVAQSHSLATLARQYRLTGLGIALLVVAALFVWRATCTFLPRRAGEANEASATAAGRSSAAALVNLLRRNIPPRDIFAVCFTEWTKSARRLGATTPEKRAAIDDIARREAAATARDRDPVAAYDAVYRALTRTQKEGQAHEH